VTDHAKLIETNANAELSAPGQKSPVEWVRIEPDVALLQFERPAG